jgi:hypothetical protein
VVFSFILSSWDIKIFVLKLLIDETLSNCPHFPERATDVQTVVLKYNSYRLKAVFPIRKIFTRILGSMSYFTDPASDLSYLLAIVDEHNFAIHHIIEIFIL